MRPYAEKALNIDGGWRVTDSDGRYIVLKVEQDADTITMMINNAYGSGKITKAIEIRQALGIR